MSEQRNQLPSNVTVNLIDSFLASLVSIVSMNAEYRLSVRAVAILFNYLKNGNTTLSHNIFVDSKVFKRFKPSREMVKAMNMAIFILSSSPKDVELALDFCAFILRYHREIDYQDFSDDH